MISSDIRYQKVEPLLGNIERTTGEIHYRRANEKNWFLNLFLVFWLCGWTVGGAAAISAVLHPKGSQPELFLLAWLGGWAVGWCAGVFTLLWSSFGQQAISANARTLSHIASVGAIRRTRHFEAGAIKNLRWVDNAVNGRARRHTSAIRFDYGARTIEIFKGIPQPEATRLIEEVEAALGIRRTAPQ